MSSDYAMVTHDNATADAAEMSARWNREGVCDASLQKKLPADIDPAAALRAAHRADERRGASSRRRKFVFRAKTLGLVTDPRRAIDIRTLRFARSVALPRDS